VFIAGLNVLEDVDLALETASVLKSVAHNLGLPLVFKASFDKANRSSMSSYRGPGLVEGLRILAEVKRAFGLPIATDVHEISQIDPVSEIADVVQIPAFLCQDVSLLTAAAVAVNRSGGWMHIKKAQFASPQDCAEVLAVVKEAVGADIAIFCERGTCLGYNNLVVDLLNIPLLQGMGVPVTMDATHAVQLPGADPRTKGASTGGRRDGVPVLAKAAVAVGVDGVFLEFHPNPDKAKCDGPSCLPLDCAASLFSTLKALRAAATAD
jgi:2-dehydro-3-deoxyphosphooctonate aldolase (KDO 8-P synthase)